jgi:hypothetical protein
VCRKRDSAYLGVHRPTESTAKKVGYKKCSTGNMAINSRPRDGRPATIHDGFSFQGIRSNAKWSTLNTEIPKGEATGNLRFVRNLRS